MKHNSWPRTSIALALLIAGVISCTKASGDVPATESAAKDNGAAHAVATVSADISGDYAIVGTNEDGSPYRGSLKVIKHGDVYQFRWDAGKQYDGVGVPNGDVVAVAFTGGAKGEGCGVVNYELLRDGTLDGKWGYWGVNQSGTERATRTTGSSLAGKYNATGKNPDGSVYEATLVVAPSGGGYKFDWSNNSSGFGVKQGNHVSVGIGGSSCAFVSYEIKPDGMLDGIWGGYGSNKTGTEKATKKK